MDCVCVWQSAQKEEESCIVESLEIKKAFKGSCILEEAKKEWWGILISSKPPCVRVWGIGATRVHRYSEG